MKEQHLEYLPLQRGLVKSFVTAFSDENEVVAAVLVGSLAGEGGDRVSDADIVVFTENGFHSAAHHCFEAFELGKEVIYQLDGFHSEKAYFKKYIFGDFTSAEIHCLDLLEPFLIAKPYKTLFDKAEIIDQRLTDQPATKHEDFPVYSYGDKGLSWELFDCIKWLNRGNTELAKTYIKRLAEKL